MIGRARRSLQLRLLDTADRLTGRAGPLVPPRRLNFVGESDFQATGEEFLQLFIALGGLQPHERVLDIGCGVGRMARPLAGYLHPPATYEGFDVVPKGIRWCQRRYRNHLHFRFQLADVANGLYRPNGGVPAREYTFPYPDGAFDFSFATSVFTHLLPQEADRYLSEMTRVTRPGGRIFATWFLLDPDGRRSGAGDRGWLSFPHNHGHYATDSDEVPEAAVAYAEDWVLERLGRYGLSLVSPPYRGTWSGRPNGVTLQDVVVARR